MPHRARLRARAERVPDQRRDGERAAAHAGQRQPSDGACDVTSRIRHRVPAGSRVAPGVPRRGAGLQRALRRFHGPRGSRVSSAASISAAGGHMAKHDQVRRGESGPARVVGHGHRPRRTGRRHRARHVRRRGRRARRPPRRVARPPAIAAAVLAALAAARASRTPTGAPRASTSRRRWEHDGTQIDPDRVHGDQPDRGTSSATSSGSVPCSTRGSRPGRPASTASRSTSPTPPRTPTEARRLAVLDARSRARTIAEAAGGRLGALVAVAEARGAGAAAAPRGPDAGDGRRTRADAGDPGRRSRSTVSVTAEWELAAG